jgi:hypothetical protein
MEEYLDEWFPDPTLPIMESILSKLMPIDLGQWNIDLYYEAMGMDFEDPTNENDPQ